MEVNKIIEGNALQMLKTLPDKSIDCCITSPPYWGLRDYGHDEQLGNEKTFKEFIDNLCNIFDEIKRVLKDEGTCFVNLGDTYAGSGGWSEFKETWGATKQLKNKSSNIVYSKIRKESVPNKCLNLIPERFAIEMIDRGWILRNQIIWHKPNQMPNSVADRFTVDFEKIFFFVKKGKYYFEQQLDPYTEPLDRWAGQMIRGDYKTKTDQFSIQERNGRNMRPNPEGKNMRTVWSINTDPTSEAHFATYPQRLVERMIKAGCPINGIVIDPFFGSGTTGIYARKVERNFVGIELNPEYVEIAKKRLYKELGMFP